MEEQIKDILKKELKPTFDYLRTQLQSLVKEISWIISLENK